MSASSSDGLLIDERGNRHERKRGFSITMPLDSASKYVLTNIWEAGLMPSGTMKMKFLGLDVKKNADAVDAYAAAATRKVNERILAIQQTGDS